MKKKLSIIALALVMLVCSIPIMPVTASDTPDYTENFSSGAIAEANVDVMSIGDPYNIGSTATSYLSVTDGVLYSMANNYANSTKKDNVLKIATEVSGKTLKKITGTMQIGTDSYNATYSQTGAISLVYKSADNKLHAVAINPNRQHSTTAGYIGNHTYTLGVSEDSWSHVLDNASGVSVGTVNNANPATGEQKFTLEYTDTGLTYTLHRAVGETTTDYSINITYADGDVKECMFLLCGRSNMLNGLSELNLYYEGTGEVVPDPEPEPEPEPEVSSTVTEDFNDEALENCLQWVSLDGRTDTSYYYTKEGTDKSFGPKNEGTSVAINTNYLSIAMENNGKRLLKVEGELYSGDGRTWGIAYQQTDGTYTGVGLDGFKEDKTGDDRYRFRLSDLASSNNAWTSSNTGYKETTISDGYAGQADLFKSKTTWISFSFEYDYSNSQVILTVQDLAKQVWTCTQTCSADMNTLVCMLAVLGNGTGSDANIPKIDNLTMTYEGTSTETESDIKVSINGPTLPTYTENMTIGYECSVSGSNIVELGMLVTLKQFVTDGNITTANLNVTDAENNTQYIKKACINDATTISSIVEKGIFYANVGSVSPDYYGARYIVRVYAKDSAGTVYYSTSTEDASKGLSGDGYAENSVISVVKAYLEFCIENQVVGIGDVASLDSGVLTYTDAYHPSTDGGQNLIEWLSTKSTDIASKVAEVKATTEQ